MIRAAITIATIVAGLGLQPVSPTPAPTPTPAVDVMPAECPTIITVQTPRSVTTYVIPCPGGGA